MPARREGGAVAQTYKRNRKPKRTTSSGGHPSRGGTTVGGGTGGRKPTRYKSPTPAPPAPSSQGHPSRGGTTVGGGTGGRKPTRYKSPTPSVKRQRAAAKKERKRERIRERRAAGRAFAELSKPGKAPDVEFQRDKDEAALRRDLAILSVPNPPKPPKPSAGGHPTRGGEGVRERIRATRIPKVDAEAKAFRENARPEAVKTFKATRAKQPRLQREAKYTRAKVDRAYANRKKDTHFGPLNVDAAGRAVSGALTGAAEKLKDVDLEIKLPQGGGRTRKTSGVSDVRNEIADLAANAPVSVYITAAAIKEAALDGDSDRLNKLWKDYKKTSVFPAALEGDFAEAFKRLKKHPVSTALEVSGAKAAVGRGAGRAMRSGALGKGAKRAAATERADLHLYPKGLPGEGPKVGQRYSKDVINKGFQVLSERRARRAGRDPDVDAGNYDVAGVSPRRPSIAGTSRRSRLMRRIDTRVFAAERVRKERVKGAVRETSKLAPHPPKTRFPSARKRARRAADETPATRLFTEGTILTRGSARADLKARLDELVGRSQRAAERGPAMQRGNRAEIEAIQSMLKLDDKALDRVAAAGIEFARQQNSRAARSRAAGMRSEGEDFARFHPVLQRHMGARFDKRPVKTAAYNSFIAAREAEHVARKELRVARRKLETSKRHAARAEGKAQIQASQGRATLRRYHGTDPETGAQLRAAGSFVGRRRPVVWAGDKATAKRYGKDLLEVEITPKKPLDVHSEQFAIVARGKSAGEIEAFARKAGYDAIVSKKDGWVKALDKDIVSVSGRPRRTDLTKPQGERLAKTQANRVAAEKNYRAAQEKLEGATKARKESRVPKDQRTERVWRGPDGRPLTQADVEAFLRSKGRDPNTVAFVTEAPVRLNSKGNAPEMYMPTMRDGGATPPMHTGRRGGERYELGREDVGAESLTRQAALSENEATIGETFQALASEFGIPAGKDGSHFADSFRAAEARARQLVEDPATGQLLPGQTRLVPMNIDGLRAYGDRLAQIQRNIADEGRSPDIGEAEDLAIGETLQTALRPSGESGKGRWVLVPEDVMQRLREHADVRTHDLAGLTNMFKDVVLTTSSPTTWLTGNISDLSFRSIMEGITPADIARGRAIIRRAETKGLQGEQAAAAVAGGGFFHAAKLGERFNPGRVNESLARTVAAAPWRAWKGGVFALEHFIEELPQFGRIGKAARQGELGRVSPQVRGFKQSAQRLLRMQDEQIDHFATRLATDRALEARIQLLTEDLIGRWGKLAPKTRRHLALAPFGQWLGAALRYTYVTLPTKHPIKTGLLASLMQATQEERSALGLSYMIPQDQRVQDYQQGLLPLNVGKNKYGKTLSGLRTSNLTSFGTAGGFPVNLPGFMLPQLRGPFNALAGTAFTGEPMVYPDWWPEKKLRGVPLSSEDRTKVATGLLLETMIPFAGAYRRSVLEKGRSSYPTSSILTPETRKKWDKEHKEYRDSEGSVFGGISEWINPVDPRSKAITHGSIRDIRQSQETGRTFQRLRDEKKKTPGYFDDADVDTGGKYFGDDEDAGPEKYFDD